VNGYSQQGRNVSSVKPKPSERKKRGAAACVERPARPRGARKLRLERIRREIEAGTYETDGKLRIAISRLIDDVIQRAGKERT
jgi:anti-sigma28 factor (negative regulator of flagellin synthesis)